MAQVPMVDSPTVAPSGAPTQVQAPGQAFGLQVLGEGLENAGKTIGADADMLAHHAQMQATLDSSAAANSAAVAVSQTQDDLALKFRNDNPGAKAQAALPQFYADLDTARAKARDSLASSPMAQRMFDDQTRLQQEKLQINNATWAAGEVKQSRVNSWRAFLDNESRGATLDSIDTQLKTITPTLQAWGAQEGWTPEQMDAAKAAWVGNTAYGLVAGVAGKDPVKAQATLDKYGEYMNPQQRGVLQNQIQASVDAHAVASVADQAFAHSLGSGPNGAPPIAKFITPEAGMAAADQNLQAKVTKHGLTTLNSIIGDPTWGWAPAADHNNPVQYAQTVAHTLGISPTDNIGQRIVQDPAFRQKVLTAMATVEGGKNNNPLNVRSAGWHGEIGQTPSEQIDGAEQAAPAVLASIASNPALRGDPILINQAQRQYLTNLAQAREVNNVATKSSFDRLYTTMIEHNIQDVGQLQQAYPQASADWASLSESSRQQLTRAAGTAANMWTPTREGNWRQLYGQALNNPQEFAKQDLTQMDLTKANRDSLYEMQQHIIAKKNAPTAQANVTSALTLEPVKQALALRPDLKPDTPEYDQFTGAYAERMQEFMDAHGGKIGAQDKAKIAIGLLAAQPGHFEFMGINTGVKTSVTAPVVPGDAAERIRQQIEPNIGRQLSDFEVGQIYAKAHQGGR